MTTIEDQLRTDLHDLMATVGPGLPLVEPAYLVEAGSQAVRRRRRRFAVVAGVTSVVAALAVGVAVLPQRSAPTIPGNTGRATTTATGPVSVTLRPGKTADSDPTAPEEYVVTVAPEASAEANVTYAAVVKGRPVLLGGSSTRGLGRASTLGHALGSDVVVGLVPDDAVETMLVDAGGAGSVWYGSGLGDLPGTGYKAVAYRLHKKPAASFVPEVLWFLRDGTPVTNDQRGHAVTFPLDGGTTVWVHEATGLFGERTLSGGGSRPAEKPLPPAQFVALAYAGGPIEVAGYVPSSAQTVAVKCGTVTRQVGSGSMAELSGTGWTAFATEITADDKAMATCTVSWTGVDGARHTVDR